MPYNCRNSIDPQCLRKGYRTVLNKELIVIHRLGPVLHGRDMRSAKEVIWEFELPPNHIELPPQFRKAPAGSGTGYKMPYHFTSGFTGLEQALPLNFHAPHAGEYNAKGIGWAILRDFSREGAGQQDYEEYQGHLAAIARAINGAFGHFEIAVAGHTYLPGGSKDPDKSCPGDGLDVERLIVGTNAQLKDIRLYLPT